VTEPVDLGELINEKQAKSPEFAASVQDAQERADQIHVVPGPRWLTLWVSHRVGFTPLALFATALLGFSAGVAIGALLWSVTR
jgi:hypothetical protein